MIDLRFLNLRDLMQIGSLTINLYGLLYAIGFFYLYKIARKYFETYKINKDLAYILIIYIIIGSIVGARIFHILFYMPELYLENPIRILMVWKGGLSIHGGLLGGVVAAILFFKKHRINHEKALLNLFDRIVIPLAIFLAIGRIINLLNGEIIGIETDVSWCVLLSGVDGCRHPVQAYAFFKNIIIFLFLVKIRHFINKPGILIGSFLTLYGFLRFFTDFFREYGSHYLGISIGQYLDILMIIAGLIIFSKVKPLQK